MHTKKPETLKEEVVRPFQCPMTISELGRINSLNVRERVSVKGEVTKVSYTSDVIDSKFLCCIFIYYIIFLLIDFQLLFKYFRFHSGCWFDSCSHMCTCRHIPRETFIELFWEYRSQGTINGHR